LFSVQASPCQERPDHGFAKHLRETKMDQRFQRPLRIQGTPKSQGFRPHARRFRHYCQPIELGQETAEVAQPASLW